jgi:2-oxoglutarate dehydrogenase complex dehydrogenase (E1) component-like enzyme
MCGRFVVASVGSELVGVLRVDTDAPSTRQPTPGAGDVGRLVEASRLAGVDVELRERADVEHLRQPIGVALYRIVQEALTNVARHAGQGATAVVTIERLYPRPIEELTEVLQRYPNARDIRWVQDEPANMGPWPHLALHLPEELEDPLDGRRIARVSRPESSSPAVGQASRHAEEQKALLDQALS